MTRDRVEVTELAEHIWLVALLGEHDLATAGEVRAAIDEVFAAGSKLILDLSGATFIDSTVLGAIMRAQLRADSGPDDELVVVTPAGSRARRTLELVHVEARVTLCDTREAAMASLIDS